MATFTAAAFSRQPRDIGGDVTVFFRYQSGTTVVGSAGDVILLAKIPSPATILDFAVKAIPGAISSGAAYTVSLYTTPGDDANSSITSASVRSGVSISAASAPFGPTTSAWGFPRISLSDDAAAVFSVLKMYVNTGSATASFSLAGFIHYTTDTD